MNSEEIKLTEYLHNIIEENISLRKQNDILWKQKLEYIGRISDAIEYLSNPPKKIWEGHSIDEVVRILKDSDVDECQ